jgi:hypothetical protein
MISNGDGGAQASLARNKPTSSQGVLVFFLFFMQYK